MLALLPSANLSEFDFTRSPTGSHVAILARAKRIRGDRILFFPLDRRAADSDLTDAEIRAQGRHKSAKVLPRYAKRTMKQVAAGAQKRRAQRQQ